jgi:hypothetical protein
MALGRRNGQISGEQNGANRAPLGHELTEKQAMSMARRAENVVDFADYRARRKAMPPLAAPDYAPHSAFMFAMPVMIPIVTWVPFWTSANVAGGESICE